MRGDTLMSETSRLEELQRRVQRDPASISFAALAEEYRRLGLFSDAIDTCRAGLLRHPSYNSARVTLGRALVEIGEYDDATAEFEQVLRSAPENLAAIRALADIHRRRGEMDYYQAPQRDVPVTPPSTPVRVAVQSSERAEAVSPVLVELEAFLAAIERARGGAPLQAAR
jgi:tetratricopeptide (TPR) repeat protein